MAGTRAGGLKVAATNKSRYGDDFYKKLGHMGGIKGRTGGFASLKIGKDGLTGLERARKAGAMGGRISRRGPVNREDVGEVHVTKKEGQMI